MDDATNRLARELADAISAAVADNPAVQACRERARAEGFEMKVSLEAVVGFRSADRDPASPARQQRARSPLSVGRAARTFEVTTNDRRFLRSLRIAADEATEPVD